LATPGKAKDFEALMNHTCPVHGFPRFRQVVCVAPESGPEGEKEPFWQEEAELDDSGSSRRRGCFGRIRFMRPSDSLVLGIPASARPAET
jgi:hypothetical protein